MYMGLCRRHVHHVQVYACSTYLVHMYENERLRGMRMSSRWLSVQIAFVYIGTVVGAGFASGREIYEFFAKYGVSAYVSILFVTILFAWLGYRLMALGAQLQARSFRDLNRYLFGPTLRKVIDAAILFMLFGTTVAMLAGTGELFRERLGLPFTIGVGCAILTTAITLLFGMNGLFGVNTVIVPVLISFVLYTTIHTWEHKRPTIAQVLHPAAIPMHWGFPLWLSALLYASMNIGLSVGVLVPLGGTIGDIRVLRKGALYGAFGLGGLLLAVTFSLFSYMPQAKMYAIPMAFIATHFARPLTWLFIAVLFGEIYSTLVGNVYAMTSTATANVRGGRRQVLYVSLATLVCAGLLSHFGFRAIVTYAYTAFGWVSLCFLFMVTLTAVRLPER